MSESQLQLSDLTILLEALANPQLLSQLKQYLSKALVAYLSEENGI
jgi:hypothetical protein